MKSLSRVRLLATARTAAYQAPPPMGFSRQEDWSGVPLPSPRVREESGKYLLLTGVEGDTGYTAQEHLKFLNGYNMGEGRTKKGLFPFLRSEILLVFVCLFF